MFHFAPDTLFLVVLALAMLAAYKADKLTTAGVLTGGLVGLFVYIGAGFIGIAMLGAFFVLAVLATSYGKKEKGKIAVPDHHPQRRNAGQVLANGGAAALLALAAYLFSDHAVMFVMLIAAAFASATADTLSSELGTVLGRRFYNIITLKSDEKGRDGVVSVEGTLIGTAGSFVIALIYSIGFGWSNNCLFIVLAGTAGNLSDSVLGATLERRGRLNNNAVNFLNTAVAALICWIMIWISS